MGTMGGIKKKGKKQVTEKGKNFVDNRGKKAF